MASDLTMQLIIKHGTPRDLPIALDLLKKAAEWLNTKEINYWQDWKNPSAAHIEWIESGFEKSEFHLAYNKDNVIVGMYRLQFSDDLFWGKREDKAGYIHSFTTNRDFKGHNIGHLILQNIERELIENGFDYLRLDCSPEVKGLCYYYEAYGFQPKETVVVHGEELRLYEKPLNR
jgi:ribosomal protein S18 acetylase RimI-like enzyme